MGRTSRGAGTPWGVTLLVFLLVLTGCGSEEAGREDRGVQHEVDTTGAFLRVVSTGTPPEWTLEPEGVVGSGASVGDPAPDEFVRVTSVTTDDQGNLWVADGGARQIKVFRPDGSLLRVVGREGRGPGEFLGIHSIAWVGDRLLALDLGNGRVAELTRSGEWVGTRPAPGRVSGSASLLRFYPVSDSVVYQWSLTAEGGSVQRVWVAHGPEGIRSERPQRSLEPPEPTGLTCHRPDGAISFFEIPFAGRMIQRPGRDGTIQVAWSGEYRIARLDAEDDTVRVIERRRPRLPVGDAEWEAARAEFLAFREEWPEAECDPRTMTRPDRKPAFRNLLVDRRERLWVETFTDSGPRWEVFDPEGQLVATVPGFAYVDRVAPSIRGDRLAWVQADSLGVQRVHVARLVTSPRFP